MKTTLILCALACAGSSRCMNHGEDVALAKKTVACVRSKPLESLALEDYYALISSARTVLAHDQYNYPFRLVLQEYKKRAAATITTRLGSSDHSIEEKVRLIDELANHNHNDAEFAPLLASREEMVSCAFAINQIEALAHEKLSLDDYCKKKLAAHAEFDHLLQTTISDMALFDGYIKQHRQGLIHLRANIARNKAQRASVLAQMLQATQLIAHTYPIGSQERAEEEQEAKRFDIKIRLQKVHDNTDLTKLERYACEIPLRQELRDTYDVSSEKYKDANRRLDFMRSYIRTYSNDPALLSIVQ